MSRYALTPFRSGGIGSYFDDFEKAFFSNWSNSPQVNTFRTDIIDRGDHCLLLAELPGIPKENIEIGINGNYLTLSARRDQSYEDKQDNYLRRERYYGEYRRQFDITGIDADGISATHVNGILELKLPKKGEEKPAARRIDIN